nr:YiiX/YebB-like N1pC/P60 family cysteine hydrolase [Aurantimonas aggregata]
MHGMTLSSLCIVLFAIMSLTTQAYAEQEWSGLANGDIIFQDRSGPRSEILKRASGTSITHVGIVRPTGGGFYVAHVMPEHGMFEEPIESFIEKGRGGRYWISRYDGLPYPPDENHPAVASAYASHYLAEYDTFHMPGNEALYDAEFINVVYGENGVDLGEPATLKSLGVRSESDLTTLFGEWEAHPVCQSRKLSAQDCRAELMDFEILTPASIAEDEELELVYTNAR